MDETSEATDVDLSHLRPVIDAAVELATNYDQEHQEVILKAVLGSALPEGAGEPAPPATVEEGGVPQPEEAYPASGLAAVAQEAEVPLDSLRRIIEVDEEKESIEILAKVEGNTTAARARRASAVYIYLKEKLFGEQEVDIDELRDVCRRQNAYDSSNFTRYLGGQDLLLERGEPGTSDRQYRLDPRDLDKAKAIIRQLVGVDEG